MSRPLRTWGSTWRVVALAAAVAVVPVPGFAGDGSHAASPPGIRAAASRIVATVPLAAAERPAAQAAQGTKPEPSSPSFFTTPAGIAVLAVVASGVGYAVYSARHDRIHSVTRSGGQ